MFDHFKKRGLFSIFSMVIALLNQLQIFWQLYLIELLQFFIDLELSATWAVALDISKAFDRVWHAVLFGTQGFTNLSLMEFWVRYSALFYLFSVIDDIKWFKMGSIYNNIQLILEFLKAPSLDQYFSCYTLITFLMILSVILLSMLMIVQLNWFCFTGLLTLVLLMWKQMSLFLRKNHL